MNNSNSQQKIFAVLHMIPRGKVTTYGQVAELAGLPRAARLVGTTLKNLPNDSTLPWHRVINAAGEISFPNDHPHHQEQRKLLIEEEVVFNGNKVSLKTYLWQP
jgi:methylated-DNA-protein-cysteine methyltransferase-like protein